MVKNVHKLLISCDVSQRMNRKLNCGKPEMHPTKVKALGIDFVGPLSPVSEDDCKCFHEVGVPRVMLSDNEAEYCNELNNTLNVLLDIKKRLTTPYHPQANGLNERFNQNLQNMLVKYVSSKREQ
ncbi:uncharacterized protein LOC136083323 [Hydra vulgaris]|uniref:Uncharacterized protein LOC136083323 n=1 Tax=Hydra vulgaris TaxID=6087 RepID=A0ABM4CAT3_HYDVU